MPITLFGSASNPADNGTGITAPVVVTPPESMQLGDLVFVTVCFSGTSGTLVVSEAGGQTWTSLTTRNQTRNRTRSFWCIFNGTWSANPSWTGSGTANVIARMLVFRPSNGTASSWEVDVAEASATYAAPTTPFTVTIPSITTITPGALVIAGWSSADDNTWNTLVGSTHTFTALTPAQVRNTSTTYQQSQTHAWMIDVAAGATGTVSQNQATLGGDAGTIIMMAFREVAAPTFIPVQSAVGTGDTIVLNGVSAGNLIVIYLNCEDATSGGASVTDGTTPLTMGTARYAVGAAEFGQFGYLLVANGGNKTYTITWPAAAAGKSVIIWEFDYGAGTLSFDQENTGQGQSTSPSSGNIATTGTDEIVFGGEGNFSAAVASAHLINSLAAAGAVADPTNAGVMWYKTFSATFTGPASCTIASAYWVCNVISFKVAAGGAYNVVAGAGSYALSGQAAGVLFGRKVATDVGGYALSGQDINALFGRKIQAEIAGYVLSGAAAGLLRAARIGADGGTYILSGLSADPLFDRLISLGAGSYVLAGQDVSLIYLTGYTLTAEAGSYTLAGQAAALLKAHKIPLEAGVYVLTGQDASLIYISGYTLAAEAGSYTLAGQAAGLLKANKIPIEAGAYVLTGQDAGVLLGRLLAAEMGSHIIIGQAAGLLRDGRLAVEAGSVVLIGADSGLVYSGVIPPVVIGRRQAARGVPRLAPQGIAKRAAEAARRTN